MTVVTVDKDAFLKAVEQMLIAMAKAKDSEGRAAPMTPTPFRAALELREAVCRMIPTGIDVLVDGWDELLKSMKVPFPSDIKN